MVGVSIVSAPMPLPVMDTTTTKGKPLPRGAARDLFRMVCALGNACARDSGVLRDGALVDSLELQAKRILRARRGAKTSIGSSFTSSPVITAQVPVPQSSNKISKRRKLPVQETTDKTRFGYDKAPLTTKPFKSLDDVGVDHMDKASLFMARADGSASLIPSAKIGKIEPYVAAVGGDVVVNSVADRSPSMSPIHMDHLAVVKPTRRPSRQSLDLGASMASTVSSYSMHQYEMSDSEDLALPLTPSARYASTHTPYDYDNYSRPITPSSDLDDSFYGGSRRKGSYYSDASNSPVFGERSSSKKLRFEMDPLSLYEKETSLKDVESGLVDTLQSQVDLLLTENVKALSENARLTELSQMSASEAEAQAAEKLRSVEQVKQQNEKIEELEMKYLDTKQRADAQEEFRREAEVAFQSELDAKMQLVTTLQQQMTIKDEEIGRLSKRVEDFSGLFVSKMREQDGARSSLTATPGADEPELVTSLRESNLFMDMELERMRASLLEKDREICNLYMHLSTKKKLIDEITKKFVQHMEEAAAAAKASANSSETPAAAAPSFSTMGVRFDLDMFLFKNVVDKERSVEELSAALSVVNREVESLEARVAEKERENTQLRENQDFLMRSLQSVNAHVCRILAEKEILSASVQEHQSRITALVSTLEDKDREVEHLIEQVESRQMQIDDLMSSDKSSGRRSLKSSLIKVRPSFSAPSVKSVSRNSKDVEKDAKAKRSSVFSDVFKDISSPLSDEDESLLDKRASEITCDEELFNELFAKA